MADFGLIGKQIDYSFSRGYFKDKFSDLELDHSYSNIDLPDEASLAAFMQTEISYKGLNVTIPYKTSVISFLDALDADAAAIGAVNTIKITSDGHKFGFNTDHYGFLKALEPFLPLRDRSALILGTGGASAAVAHVLANLDFRIQYVSRHAGENSIRYEQVDKYVLLDHLLIVNCTPLGTYPDIEQAPVLPYKYLTQDHLLFDLVYNPELTQFMKHGLQQGGRVSNGYQMLVHQAEKAWEIWNS